MNLTFEEDRRFKKAKAEKIFGLGEIKDNKEGIWELIYLGKPNFDLKQYQDLLVQIAKGKYYYHLTEELLLANEQVLIKEKNIFVEIIDKDKDKSTWKLFWNPQKELNKSKNKEKSLHFCNLNINTSKLTKHFKRNSFRIQEKIMETFPSHFSLNCDINKIFYDEEEAKEYRKNIYGDDDDDGMTTGENLVFCSKDCDWCGMCALEYGYYDE